eukprot:15452291-Alexandrium_andersonii.AAC.1
MPMPAASWVMMSSSLSRSFQPPQDAKLSLCKHRLCCRCDCKVRELELHFAGSNLQSWALEHAIEPF